MSAPRDDSLVQERIVPIKIAGHWEDALVHVGRGDLFIDIPAELIRLVEADQPGTGERWGYQLLIEHMRIAEFFRDDLRRRNSARRRKPTPPERLGLWLRGLTGSRHGR